MQVHNAVHSPTSWRSFEPESEDDVPAQRGAVSPPAAPAAPATPSTTLAELAAQPHMRAWRDPEEQRRRSPQPVAAPAPAPIAALAPAPAAAPSAGPQERALLELMLADPLNQALVTAWGGSPAPSSGGLATELAARYGPELLGRLDQLSRATAAVREQYRQALDAAAASPPAWGAADPPGWSTTLEGSGDNVATVQRFSVDAYSAWYAQQDSLASRAFAQLYGRSQTTVTEQGESATTTTHIDIGSGLLTLQRGQWLDIGEGGGQRAWSATSIGAGALSLLDPAGNPELVNRSAVWFDPALGWVTPPDNFVQHPDWLDRALPVVAAIGAAWLVGPAAAEFGAAVGGATGSAVLGAAATAGTVAAASSAAAQLVATGGISFKDVLRSALAGAVTGGVLQAAEWTPQALQGQSFAARALALTGRATLQGALQELSGGRFKDGLTNGLAGGLAAEIGAALNERVAAMQGSGQLSPVQASAWRLLAQATGSAVRALASPDAPGHAFATEFLGSLVQEALPADVPASPVPTFTLDPDLVLPSADQAVGGLLGLKAERFEQLVNSMAQAGDREGLEALRALLQGEAQRGSANANAGAVFFAQQQYAQLLARGGQINQALQGLPLGGVPGQPMPDPDDPTRQAPPGYSIDAQRLQDLINTRPAEWPDWAQGLLVRLQLSAQQLRKYGTTTFPGLVVTAADLLILREGQDKFRRDLIGEAKARNWGFDPTGYEAHHIVPVNEYPELNSIRAKLAEWGINVNDPANGVLLPTSKAPDGAEGTLHRDTRYNDTYEKAIKKAFEFVTNAAEARFALGRIKTQLQNGTFIPPKP